MALIYRRFIASFLIASLALSLAGYAAAPTGNETFRIVRIHGRRVHLRSGVPPQLTHENVIRHLRDRQTLIADRIGYGIGYDGKGVGEWLHVTDPDNGECGWVNAKYIEVVADIPTHAIAARPPDPQLAALAPIQPGQPVPSAVHDTPPPDAISEVPTFLTNLRKKYGSDLQFAANVAALVAVFLSAVMLMQKGAVPPRSSSTPTAPPLIPAEAPIQTAAASAANTHKAHFFYGMAGGAPYRISLPKH